MNSAGVAGELLDSFNAAIHQLNASSQSQPQQPHHDVPLSYHRTAADHTNSLVHPPPRHT